MLNCAVFFGSKSLRKFSAFTGVALSAKPVHGDCQCLVGLLGKGSVAHGSCLESLYDIFFAFNFLDRNGLTCWDQGQKSSQRMRSVLVVHHVCVLPKQLVVSFPYCSLQCHDGFGTVHVVFHVVAASKRVETKGVKALIRMKSKRVEGSVMALFNVLANLLYADTANSAGGSGEILVYKFF